MGGRLQRFTHVSSPRKIDRVNIISIRDRYPDDATLVAFFIFHLINPEFSGRLGNR